jgi:hypothetical protein
VLSVIKWERRPAAGVVDNLTSWLGMGQQKDGAKRVLHSIEVYIYSEAGQLVRDYSATYLPGHRNAPMQTLIFLHDYRGGLHAFRSFDAGGNRIYEACRGTHDGKEVDIEFDEDQIFGGVHDSTGAISGDLYKFCFERIPTSVEDYLPPR